MNLEKLIRDIPDFPKPGILFKDITPIFQEPDAIRYVHDTIAGAFAGKGVNVVAGAESRGFLIGPGIAERLGASFIPVRKPGRLPYETISHSYELEYGSDTLEIHKDAVKEGDNVLLVDDLLATGGTIGACTELVTKLGAKVTGAAFIIELAFLNGRDKLGDTPVHSLVSYS